MSEEVVDPFERLEDNLPEPTSEPSPTAVIPEGEACFPVRSDGMPKALLSIPSRERGWFWNNMRYRGFFVAHVDVQDERHRYLFEREEVKSFYVRNEEGTVGLVPFPASTIVWPHEKAWEQDLAPENKGKVRPDLRPSERKKK